MKLKRLFILFVLMGSVITLGTLNVNAADWVNIPCDDSASGRQVVARAIDDRWITKQTSVSCSNSLAEAIARVKSGNEAATAETTGTLRSVTALLDCYDSHSHSFKSFYG